MRKLSLAAFAALALSGGQAWAITCAGVEARVNFQTSSVSSTITALIATRQTAIVAQEVMERQRLLSAVRVLTKQMATSGEQEVVSDRAADLALSNVIVEQSVNEQTRQAVEDYGNTGHNACEIVERGQTVADMVASYGSARAATAEAIRAQRSPKTVDEFRSMMGDWAAIVRNSDDATISAVLDGDAAKAAEFIAVVAGPPRPPIQAGSGSVASQQDRVIALRDEARNSAAVLVLTDIAASQRVQAALDEMSNEWIGRDGGQEWAAVMAASPTRAVLLDTARIEAQTIASMALEMKRTVMEEFALASFSLTYVDRMIERESGRDAQ